MDLGLSDKVAVVAGGASGCGLAIAEELAKEGARVVLSSRDSNKVDTAAAGIRASGAEALGIAGDMAVKADATRIVEEARRVFGDPDILVVNPPGPGARSRGFENTPDEEFRDANEQWVMSFVFLAREVLPAMKRKRWGRIVNVGSIGMKVPHLADPMYAQNTRVGVVGVVKTVSHEYGRDNITANTIATGPFMTELTRSYLADAGALSEDHMIGATAMGRWGKPEEMGAVVAFLCSERASYISGETIRVDGGYTHNLF